MDIPDIEFYVVIYGLPASLLQLYQGLGSDESLPAEISHSCDACGDLPAPNFKYIHPVRAKRTHKPKAVHKVPDHTMVLLKNRLKLNGSVLFVQSSSTCRYGRQYVHLCACLHHLILWTVNNFLANPSSFLSQVVLQTSLCMHPYSHFLLNLSLPVDTLSFANVIFSTPNCMVGIAVGCLKLMVSFFGCFKQE